MKPPILLAAAALLFLSGSAKAQWPWALPPRPAAYEGYWNPYYQPGGWDHRMTRLTFVNRTFEPIDLYYLDRYDRWVWRDRILPSRASTVESPVGDYWVARGRDGRVIQRAQALRGPQTVEVRVYAGHPDRPGPAHNRVRLTFRNKTKHDVNLYAINRYGRWIWVGKIPDRGGEIQVTSWEKQRWRGVDERGRTVKTYEAGRHSDVIVIKD